ncbi:clan AA aspartic protease, TIGR02281 family [Methylomagnum ishizawai]|uniref:Clan AA aspartic protease, TIGR02281 family n=1 Tax=Methylomagnum ishizawai TaxID=1760988 RepID=A0A1Y6CTL3_9GAMM|nr:TIGR02281 family clan AA aspartic protease [Methylomagnum ishizawai]SMF93771.1 clan AA aspartic protease, TIGR02281 family [Methylomagnum ishizawai]
MYSLKLYGTPIAPEPHHEPAPPNRRRPAAPPPTADDSPSAASRVVHYHKPGYPPKRNRLAIVTRLVAAGTWLLILGLVATLLKQLHTRQPASPSPPAAKVEAAAPTALEPPPETAPTPEPEATAATAPEPAAPPETPVSTPAAPESPAPIQVAEVVITPAKNGNFYAPGEINGKPVTFVVDTGASFVSIPDKLRWNLNLTRGQYVQTMTANGVAGMYAAKVDALKLGPIRLKNIEAVLITAPMPGDVVLLGMSALRELRMQQENGQLILQQDVAPGTGPDEAAAPRPAPPAALKKSVSECMGGDKVVNARVLRCMRGEDGESAAE